MIIIIIIINYMYYLTQAMIHGDDLKRAVWHLAAQPFVLPSPPLEDYVLQLNVAVD